MSVLPIVVLTIPVTRKIGPYFDSKIPYSDSDPNVEMVVSQEKQEATFNRLVEVFLPGEEVKNQFRKLNQNKEEEGPNKVYFLFKVDEVEKELSLSSNGFPKDNYPPHTNVLDEKTGILRYTRMLKKTVSVEFWNTLNDKRAEQERGHKRKAETEEPLDQDDIVLIDEDEEEEEPETSKHPSDLEKEKSALLAFKMFKKMVKTGKMKKQDMNQIVWSEYLKCWVHRTRE